MACCAKTRPKGRLADGTGDSVRQLWAIQQGTRNGAAVQLMKMAIVNLTNQDLVAVAA